MPISQFASGIGNFVSMLPETHGTALLKKSFNVWLSSQNARELGAY